MVVVFLARGGSAGEVGEILAPPGLGDVRDYGQGEVAAAVATGLRLTSTGKVVPSLRSPTSRAPAPIGRALGAARTGAVATAYFPQAAGPGFPPGGRSARGRKAEHLLQPPVDQREHAVSSASATPSGSHP